MGSDNHKKATRPSNPNFDISVEIMSDESEIKINTGVFWDLDDFPVPDNLNPALIDQNIKSALEKKGYGGEVSISAYVQKKTLPDELLNKFLDAGIKIKSVPQDSKHKNARVTSVYLSIMVWAVENPQPANIMVISNNISEDTEEFVNTLSYLKERDYNVLLAEPLKVVSELVLDSVSSIWCSSSLLDGGNLINQS